MTIMYRIGKIKKDNKTKESQKVIYPPKTSNKKRHQKFIFLVCPCLRAFLQFHL